MELTIVFNNYSTVEDLQPAWGMAAFLENGKDAILFDTGSSGDVLLFNLKVLKLEPKRVRKIVISHNHWDHVGGLVDFVRKNSMVEIYAPALDEKTYYDVTSLGAIVRWTDAPQFVTSGISTTGVLSGPVPEQALVVAGHKGHTILTGCSHPGVARLVASAPRPRYLVTGGFHLFRSRFEEIKQTAVDLANTGVELIAPSHCTGELAIEYFEEVFGSRLLYGGLGARFSL